MHELTLAEDIIQLVESVAAREGARHVRTVVVEIGRLSAVEPDALRFAFDAVKLSGPARDAELALVDIPGEGQCESCNARMAMDQLYALCPNCGSPQVVAVAGREMRVREIEID